MCKAIEREYAFKPHTANSIVQYPNNIRLFYALFVRLLFDIVFIKMSETIDDAMWIIDRFTTTTIASQRRKFIVTTALLCQI